MSAREAVSETIDGHVVRLSNASKVLYPRDGITKGDVVAYYRRVAPFLLPHLRGRPFTMQRFPDGIDGMQFFAKDAPRGVPDWVEQIELRAPGASSGRGAVSYMLISDEAGLAYVANLGSIVQHVWTSKVPHLESPDFIFFDLDPGERATIGMLAKVALRVRDELALLGLDALVKSSGGIGLHVVVPLEQRYSYDEVKLFTEAIARRIAAAEPKRVTLERTIARRPQDRIYFDWVQVGRGKTIVPAYSLRARDGAPVSTPLEWSEVETLSRKRSGHPEEVFAGHTIRTIFRRLERLGDLWDERSWKPQRLEGAIRRAREQWDDDI